MTAQSAASVTARAAVLRETGGKFKIEDVTVAPPRADEVLVRMVGVGVCHTDMVCRDGFPIPLPMVLGHEGSGVVEAVGENVKRVKPGDHVVLSFNSCGQCPSCTDHHPATCTQFLGMNFAGVRLNDGSTPLSQDGKPVHSIFFGQSSFATYAIAREINTVPVPKNVPLEILGPLGCGIQTGAGAAINSMKVGPKDSIVVFGGGSVGLSAVMGAKAMDAKTIIVVEPNAERRALAKQLGATHAFDPRDGSDVVAAIKEATGGGVRYAIDTTGIPPVIKQALDSVAPGGKLGLIGMSPPDAAIPATLMDLAIKSVTLQPIIEGDADPQAFIPKMIELYQAGKFPFDKLITKFPFDQINEASHASETGAAIKPVLVF
ncbi:MAG: NAD(P)-dependent alcohol dehydrogenase [Rhodocyclaceae bacterium]|jgi:aryl-alcohol dehydrogenase/geraniol dehydrogenase (NAD+)|nr:NAD(P)-dependent alcohol dehydrogenase [Rhodocyclaceae bacterium]